MMTPPGGCQCRSLTATLSRFSTSTFAMLPSRMLRCDSLAVDQHLRLDAFWSFYRRDSDTLRC